MVEVRCTSRSSLRRCPEAGVRRALETGDHGDPALPVTDDTPVEAAE